MLHSMLHNNSDADVEVHFLHAPGFSPSHREQLGRFVGENGGSIRFHAIDDRSVSHLPATARLPHVMWYRLFLPELLPDVDRVLYLDADTLVVDRIAPLWDLPLDESYVAAVSNVFEPQFANRPSLLGLDPTQEYFNSGVLLFNLAKMRHDGVTRRMLRFATEQQLLWPDQDVLNVVLGRARVHLDPRWNCMNSLFYLEEANLVFGRDAVRAACSDPAIVHFEGSEMTKPWHYLSKHPYRSVYCGHRAETPWPTFPIDGRTLSNRLLRPLPTATTIKVLTRSRQARAKVRARVAGASRGR
jgi:lipopolysaccharide biosynthesis glycosyltransferase